MALAYTPPGVSVQEFSNPTISPILAVPANPCIIGLAAGVITKSETVLLVGTTASSLSGVPAGATMTTGSIVSVTDAVNPQNQTTTTGYSANTDYTFTPSTYQIAATANGALKNGATVTVTYTYTPADYFQPIRLNSMQDIESRFGNQYDSTKTIVNSSLSYAAQIAFENGASSIICQPLYKASTATSGGTFAVQTLTINGAPTGGTFTLTFGGQTTSSIVYNPAASAIQTALQALSSVGAGNLLVTGSGASFTLTFAGTLVGPQPLVTHTDSLTGGSTPSIGITNSTIGILPGTTTSYTQPSNSDASNPSTWQTVLAGLRTIEDINLIVPVVGQSMFGGISDATQLGIIQTVQDHIEYMKQVQNQYIVAVFGEDNSGQATVANDTTLTSHASILASRYAGDVNQQMAFVCPASFNRQLPQSQAKIALGAQYAAAAICGMLCARPVSQPLTRKVISGFTSIADPRTKDQMNADAGAGLLVLEQRGLNIRVRHGVTLDTTSTLHREISIVRAKFRMATSLQETIDNQIIGQVVADGDAAAMVAQAVIGVLTALRGDGTIVDFNSVQARTLTIDPTNVEVRFNYRPAYPVNYVTIGFAVDITSGVIQVPSTLTTVGSGTTF